MYKILLILATLTVVTGCSTTTPPIIGSAGDRSYTLVKHNSELPYIDAGGRLSLPSNPKSDGRFLLRLRKNSDAKWMLNEGKVFESLIVDVDKRTIELTYDTQEDSTCIRFILFWELHPTSGRLCNSPFGKSKKLSSALGILALPVTGLFMTYVNSAAEDEDAIREAVKSTGLIDAAEKMRPQILTMREKENERLAADEAARQGDANAKFQRGMEYLGGNLYNRAAEYWFTEAANTSTGHADALVMLGNLQLNYYKNKVKAEEMWRKAAQLGSASAQKAIREIDEAKAQEAQAASRQQALANEKLAQVNQKVQAQCMSLKYSSDTANEQVAGILHVSPDAVQLRRLYIRENPLSAMISLMGQLNSPSLECFAVYYTPRGTCEARVTQADKQTIMLLNSNCANL